MQRENFIRGSRSSNWTSNFLRRSVRSLTDFKSSLLFKSSSLLGGVGAKAVGFEIFGFSIFSLFVFSTI
ncbi:hypothetical protein C2R93_01235 [Helicobacter pylori]|nr:hypothetical protein C2R93_01235 [Helicobacter pylori]RVY87109.1 hypothetical protein EC505_00930 [Helicobacter pylori]